MAWAGVTAWSPVVVLIEAMDAESLQVVRRVVLDNFVVGMLFAVSLLAILTAHELGHYFMTRWYGIASTHRSLSLSLSAHRYLRSSHRHGR